MLLVKNSWLTAVEILWPVLKADIGCQKYLIGRIFCDPGILDLLPLCSEALQCRHLNPGFKLKGLMVAYVCMELSLCRSRSTRLSGCDGRTTSLTSGDVSPCRTTSLGSYENCNYCCLIVESCYVEHILSVGFWRKQLECCVRLALVLIASLLLSIFLR